MCVCESINVGSQIMHFVVCYLGGTLHEMHNTTSNGNRLTYTPLYLPSEKPKPMPMACDISVVLRLAG
jgi:hypothetical protein